MNKGIASIWLILITVLIMAGLGGGGYYYLNGKFQNQKKEKDDQIATLTKELKDLRTAADTKEEAASSASSSSASSSASTTSTSISNTLNTYTSTTYGYRFQYPKTMSLVDWFWNGLTNARVPQNGKVVWLSKTALSERAIPMDADPISQYLSFSIMEEMCGLSAIRGDGTNIVIEDTTLDGNPAWKARTTAQDDFGGQFSTTYYSNHGNYCYQIRIVNSDAAGTHDAAIETIVSSFKFL